MLRLGLGLALAVFALDRVSKELFLGPLDPGPFGVAIAPFFNLVRVWNKGVSFGLFHSEFEFMRWGLAGFALVVSVALTVWLRRAENRLVAAALGLVIGGAVSNALDRVLWGAVFDFLDFHAWGWHWPAFNIADSAIVLGVGGLLWDGLWRRPEAPK
ncbi:MAG: signal peptidase II [Alphaproteobacteria bacterium]|nr:signal peptidase II [Alphaproteobacteria bacterium]